MKRARQQEIKEPEAKEQRVLDKIEEEFVDYIKDVIGKRYEMNLSSSCTKIKWEKYAKECKDLKITDFWELVEFFHKKGDEGFCELCILLDVQIYENAFEDDDPESQLQEQYQTMKKIGICDKLIYHVVTCHPLIINEIVSYDSAKNTENHEKVKKNVVDAALSNYEDLDDDVLAEDEEEEDE